MIPGIFWWTNHKIKPKEANTLLAIITSAILRIASSKNYSYIFMW